MRVTILGDFKFKGAPHWYGMKEAFEYLGHEVTCLEGTDQHDSLSADLVIVGSHSWAGPELYGKKGDATLICWMCDTVHNFNRDGISCDRLFSVRPDYGELLMQASLTRDRIVRDAPNNDIVFIGNKGNSDPIRAEVIKTLNPVVYYHDENLEKREEIYRNTPSIYGNAAICLGVDYSKEVPFAFSNRIWNTLGCGGFYLTIYTKGMEELFKNHRHLVWADSVSEMKELADYYMSHQEEARKIAKRGFHLVQMKHTYRHRIKDLCQRLR